MFDVKTGRMTAKAAKKNVVIFVTAKGKFTTAATMLDKQSGSDISNALKGSRFDGNNGEFFRVTTSKGGLRIVLLAGIGKVASLERSDWWKVGLALGKQIDAMGIKDITLALGDIDSGCDATEQGLALVEGMHMSMYRFDEFKTDKKPLQAPRFEKLTILTNAAAAKAIAAAMPKTKALLEGVDATRRAANLPPNIANPQFMADEAEKLAKSGIKVQVFDEKDLAKMGCNLILAVGGSAAPKDQPRLVIMTYEGAGKGKPYTAIVGKGIMFDTGGYNVKPGNSMRGMKFDMSGAAAVLGTMKALAVRKPKINVVGVMTCAMNMIGQTSFVMDSIYKSYKGLNVEIGHTDAEGRLVLADAVAYTIEKFEPEELVDLATLTGACMVALGGGYAGLFSTKDALANALTKAADTVGERVWRLPVDDFYTSKSEVADICNDSMAGWGGASIGAAFIKKFADKTPWAHLDIAGVANADKIAGSNAHLSGSTGWGVRLLVNWLEGKATNAAAADVPAAKGKRRGRGRPRNA